MSGTSDESSQAIRGDALTFTNDPFLNDICDCLLFVPDAMIVMRGGKITAFGPASDVAVAEDVEVTEYKNCLIMAGFIDCHVHYPQTQIIGAYGGQLIDWLNKHTFEVEQKFRSKEHGREVADIYLTECLRNGTTTAMTYCTVYPQSVDAFFEESEKRNMRNIAGKVLMDRNAPEPLLDTPQQGYDETKALIKKWHGRGRQLYCVSPRFAPTSTAEQLEMAGAVWNEHPGTYLQTHVSETQREMSWVGELFPDRDGYLDVYDHFGHLGPRSMLGHGIHLSERELHRCYESGSSIAHCPTSNLFLGSGLFSISNAMRSERPVRVGLGTDLGAGTSFSALQTLNEAYKISQLNGYPLRAAQAFYLATRGSAQALYLEDKIGSIAEGMEADLAVIDLYSTPIIRYRMKHCEDLEEALFVQMTMGDDRAIRATYVAGALAYDREETEESSILRTGSLGLAL